MLRRPLVATLATLSLSSCSLDVGSLTGGAGKKKKNDKGAAGESETPAEGADGQEQPGDAKKSNEDTGDESQGSGNAAVDAVVKDCGGDKLTNAGPDEVVYERSAQSLPITKSVLLVRVTASTKLSLKVTGAKTEQTSEVKVVKIEPPAFEGLAKSRAEAEAKANSGKVVMTNVPFKEYANLSQHKAWEGIICTFIPATKVESGRGGRKTVAEFDPPMPLSISPRAVKARYDAEIGAARSFQDLTVKIVSSDDPALAGKKTVKGTVNVERVSASAQVDDGAGGKKTIKGGIAYKLTYDFESPAVTYALGLPPEATFYVNLDAHELAASVIDTKAQGGGRAVFIYD